MTSLQLLKTARCGACKGKIGRVNFCQLERVATWQYPVGANVLTGEDNLAVAVMCDSCVDRNAHPKEAVEIKDGKIVYHPLEELQPYKSPPAVAFKRAMLEEEDGR